MSSHRLAVSVRFELKIPSLVFKDVWSVQLVRSPGYQVLGTLGMRLLLVLCSQPLDESARGEQLKVFISLTVDLLLDLNVLWLLVYLIFYSVIHVLTCFG